MVWRNTTPKSLKLEGLDISNLLQDRIRDLHRRIIDVRRPRKTVIRITGPPT